MKNKILKTITAIAIIGLLLSACCLDADSWIPEIVMGICIAYLLIFTAANQDKINKL